MEQQIIIVGHILHCCKYESVLRRALMYLVIEDESENISALRKGLNNMKWWEASSPTCVFSEEKSQHVLLHAVCISFS